MNRQARIERKTGETAVVLHLDLDGQGKADLETGLPFLDHMLTLWCRHGFFDLNIRAEGDLQVDPHHLVEDLAICLGRAVREACADKQGLARYGNATIPMDEALVTAVIDLSGRPHLTYQFDLPSGLVGPLDGELFREFWQAFANEGALCLHLTMHHGLNKHHIIEASFKAAARALNEATSILRGFNEVLSTKGKLE